MNESNEQLERTTHCFIFHHHHHHHHHHHDANLNAVEGHQQHQEQKQTKERNDASCERNREQPSSSTGSQRKGLGEGELEGSHVSERRPRCHRRRSAISITLEGYKARDLSATNLEWTGQTNWIASQLLAQFLISAQGWESYLQPAQSVLELGSGLGRAGILAAKLLVLEQQQQQHYDNEDGVADDFESSDDDNAEEDSDENVKEDWPPEEADPQHPQSQPHSSQCCLRNCSGRRPPHHSGRRPHHRRRIVLTDGEPRILKLLERNCHLNDLKPQSYWSKTQEEKEDAADKDKGKADLAPRSFKDKGKADLAPRSVNDDKQEDTESAINQVVGGVGAAGIQLELRQLWWGGPNEPTLLELMTKKRPSWYEQVEGEDVTNIPRTQTSSRRNRRTSHTCHSKRIKDDENTSSSVLSSSSSLLSPPSSLPSSSSPSSSSSILLFDLILAADVLYERVAPKLFYTVSQLLSKPTSTAISSSSSPVLSSSTPIKSKDRISSSCRSSTNEDDDDNRRPHDGGGGGKFVLAYTKRDTYSEAELLSIAALYDLQGHRLPNYNRDLFWIPQQQSSHYSLPSTPPSSASFSSSTRAERGGHGTAAREHDYELTEDEDDDNDSGVDLECEFWCHAIFVFERTKQQ